ncbi:MAG: ORF6N domain-containing protein [Steroidobacteraceae bacterium]
MGNADCMPRRSESVEARDIADQIRIVRGQRVLLDSDLAELYGVETRMLNQAVRRNIERFPADFLLQLTESEVNSLRSQIVILKRGRGQHRKFVPLAFTEHGAIMAATVLNSPRAIEMSVYVVRAFLKLRELLSSNAELARKLDALEKSVASLDANTRRQFDEVYSAILSLMGPDTTEQ